MKKPAGSVRFDFGFINLKPKKPNRTEPKPEKTESNRFEPVFVLKNQTKTRSYAPLTMSKSTFLHSQYKKNSLFDSSSFHCHTLQPQAHLTIHHCLTLTKPKRTSNFFCFFPIVIVSSLLAIRSSHQDYLQQLPYLVSPSPFS